MSEEREDQSRKLRDALEREGQSRKIRDALEAQLGEKIEAAGVFEREDTSAGDLDILVRPFEWLYERLTMGRVGRLQGTFLLAVTSEKVRASTFRKRAPNFGVHEELAVFDRDEIRLRRTPKGEIVWLYVTEGGRTRKIALEGEVVDENPGAADVLAALSD